MIGADVNYGKCARDPPEGTWDFPVVTQMNMSYVQPNIVPEYVCL